MMRVTKYLLIVCVVLNFLGHPMESKVVGWDYCTEEGHPFILNVYKFGFPIPGVIVNQIWGCLSTPNQWVEYSWPGIIGTSVFWTTVFWILTFWPMRARARRMTDFDTCYFLSGEGYCTFDDYYDEECSHVGVNGSCLADDEDLLTYEDYLQMKSSEFKEESEPQSVEEKAK